MLAALMHQTCTSPDALRYRAATLERFINRRVLNEARRFYLRGHDQVLLLSQLGELYRSLEDCGTASLSHTL